MTASIETLRRIGAYAICEEDRAWANAQLADIRERAARERNAWRLAAMEAIRDGRAFSERAARRVYVPWDGRMTALSR
jgi:hypothetical protein